MSSSSLRSTEIAPQSVLSTTLVTLQDTGTISVSATSESCCRNPSIAPTSEPVIRPRSSAEVKIVIGPARFVDASASAAALKCLPRFLSYNIRLSPVLVMSPSSFNANSLFSHCPPEGHSTSSRFNKRRQRAGGGGGMNGQCHNSICLSHLYRKSDYNNYNYPERAPAGLCQYGGSVTLVIPDKVS